MSAFHLHDWVSRHLEAVGGAAFRKLQRLRDAANRSMPGSKNAEAYGRWYTDWQNGTAADHERLVHEAEAEEKAAQQGVPT